jgi:hypothetical protein
MPTCEPLPLWGCREAEWEKARPYPSLPEPELHRPWSRRAAPRVWPPEERPAPSARREGSPPLVTKPHSLAGERRQGLLTQPL